MAQRTKRLHTGSRAFTAAMEADLTHELLDIARTAQGLDAAAELDDDALECMHCGTLLDDEARCGACGLHTGEPTFRRPS